MIAARLASVLTVLIVAALALAQDVRTWTSLDEGLAAAKRSGRPVLVVTKWRGGVCNTCDTWRDRVPRDPDVLRQLARFEQVEWLYDGQGGKVIGWTKEHGGTSDDPAVQAFVVAADTGKIERAPMERVYVPAEFAKWLKEEADAFDKAHPATKLHFAAAPLTSEQDGTTLRWTCAAIDEARAARRPVLVYVTRGERENADKAAKTETAASRKLEKGPLDSDQAAKATANWTLVKLDLADPDAAAYAKTLGIEKAPALLAFVPGDDKPQTIDLASVATGDALAFKLRKLATSR